MTVGLVATAFAGAPAPTAEAGSAFTATMHYEVAQGAYNNSVRVANLSDMNNPVIASDRSPSSSFNGTVYVIGLRYTNFFVCEPLVVVRSLDGGATFEPPESFDLCLEGGSVDAVVAANGTVYVATPGPIVLRSTDRGVTWERLATVADQPGITSLAMDPATGFLYLAWYYSGDSARFSPQFSASRDGGVTWSPSMPILPIGQDGTSAEVAAFNHTAVVSLVRQGASNSTVVATRFADDGTNESTPQVLSPTTYCMLYAAPAIAASPRGLFAISWYADPAYLGTGCWDGWGNTTETFVSLSADGGITFSPPRHVGGPPGWPTWNFGHTIAFDDASRVYVAWWAPNSTLTNSIYVATSTDSGASFNESSFLPTFTVSGGNTSGPNVLSPGPGDRVFLGWSAYYTSESNLSEGAGIYVRTVSGAAEGDVVNGTSVASLQIGIRDAVSGGEVTRLPWNGSLVAVEGLPPGDYGVWVYSADSNASLGLIPVRAWGLTTFTIQIGSVQPYEPPGGPGETPTGVPLPWWFWLLVTTGGSLAAIAIVASLLHARLVREEVLQRKVRLLLYEYIRDHPGATFSEVRDAAGLQNGVAAYHLGVLEKQGLLHSESRRRHRWYYPNGDVSLWRILPLSAFQKSVVEEVQRSPGIGVRELARRLDRRASSVAYSVKGLSREGVLRTERTGTRLRCFAVDDPPRI